MSDDMESLLAEFRNADDHMEEMRLRSKRYWREEKRYPDDPSDWLDRVAKRFEVEDRELPSGLQEKFRRYATEQVRMARHCLAAGDSEGLAVAVMLLDENINAVRWNIRLHREAVYSEIQRDKGVAGAEARWGDRDYQNKVIASLAARKDWMGFEPIPDLWSLLFSRLDLDGMHPEDTSGAKPVESDRITWEGNSEGITYKRFRNKVGECRRSLDKK